MKFRQIRWGVLFIFTIFLLLKTVNAIPSNSVIFYNNLTRICSYAAYVYPISQNSTYSFIYNSNSLQYITFNNQNPYITYAVKFPYQNFAYGQYYFAGYNASKNITIPSYSYELLANYTIVYFNTSLQINDIFVYLLKNLSCITNFENPTYMHNFFTSINGAIVFSPFLNSFSYINSTTIEANQKIPFILAIPSNLTLENLSYYFTNSYSYQFAFYQYISTNTLYNQIKSLGSISSQYITIPSNNVILKQNQNVINTNPLSLVFFNTNNSIMSWQGLGILYNYTLYNYSNKIASQISFNTHTNFYLNSNNNKFHIWIYPIPISFNYNYTYVNNNYTVKKNTTSLGGYQYKINFTITNWNENYSFPYNKSLYQVVNTSYAVFEIPNYTQLSSSYGPFTNMYINYSYAGVNHGQVNFCILPNSTIQNAYIVITRKTLSNYMIANNTNITIYFGAVNPLFWKSYDNQTLCNNFVRKLTSGQNLGYTTTMYNNQTYVNTSAGVNYFMAIVHLNLSVNNPLYWYNQNKGYYIYMHQYPTYDSYTTNFGIQMASNPIKSFYFISVPGSHFRFISNNLVFYILSVGFYWENQSGIFKVNGSIYGNFGINLFANSTITYNPPFSTNVKVYKAQLNNQVVNSTTPSNPNLIIVSNNTIIVNTTNLANNQSALASFLKNQTYRPLFNVKIPSILLILIILITLFGLSFIISTKNMVLIAGAFFVFSIVYSIINFEISILMVIISFLFIYANHLEGDKNG